ncbi:CotH kinase family protein [Alkaliphilus hydrothermalis]|uniref:LTD domain-containing protein n=1 Tax=Alkaliphilus hydrothermalis TaxID=1482730 RepID=A0ABS2NKQ1_9FIRM|nr:CotH kinase family protein [Alkaliphilus hydrothermalis]MBM7613514.1 hypothetical protein [Alkaliphilus hydrothermalis]
MKGVSRIAFVVVLLMVIIFLGFKEHIQPYFANKKPMAYPLVINEVMVKNRNSIRDDDGDFEGWIELYNHGDEAINLQGFGLSKDSKNHFMWRFGNQVIEPKSFCVVWTSGKDMNVTGDSLHTNFKLKTGDKVMILTAPDEEWKDIFLLEKMEENSSYGRSPDGDSTFYGFDGGTPGKPNTLTPLVQGPSTKRLEAPVFSHDSGFYPEGLYLTIESTEIDSEIYYTLDGSTPTEKSLKYKGKILISPKGKEATIIRAKTVRQGYPDSDVNTQSYFVGAYFTKGFNMPIISLVTDPKNLFDYEQGIYVAGRILDQWKTANPNERITSNTPANYNQRGKLWEREACMELFEEDGIVAVKQNIGIRTHGGYSRAGELKSLSLFARSNYDEENYFSYDFFSNIIGKTPSSQERKKVSRILLRTSATDRRFTLFRDALIQSLIPKSINLDRQESRPCIVYINGEYYGIHNIREAYDKDYIRRYYDIDEADVVIISNPTGDAGVEMQSGYVGDEMHYNRMINYVKEHSLNVEEAYNFIKTQMDIDNFIEYCVLQIYCDNRDWPGNNVKVWRKRTDAYEEDSVQGHDGRWRWMVFDLDYGFGLYQGVDAASNNSIKQATEVNGPDWPNPPWSTLLLRSLLRNEDFKNQFINRFADRLNEDFLPANVVGKIEIMENIYEPSIKDHIIRWNLHNQDVRSWKEEVSVLKSFARKRPNYLRQHIVDYFNLEGTASIKIEIDQGGTVKVNSIEVQDTEGPWEGIYFKDIPIKVEAIPKSGYRFVGWRREMISRDAVIAINLSKNLYIKAVFLEERDGE